MWLGDVKNEMKMERSWGSVMKKAMVLLLLMTIGDGDPIPRQWPERFHAVLYMNISDGRLQITDLWYDWSAGRNVNLIQKQLGDLLHDVEWNNGTSYYYTVGPNSTNDGDCNVREFGVGIPRPDFLDDATYLRMEYTDGFLCNLWTKLDFIWYWEDVLTQIPVRWDFYDGTHYPHFPHFIYDMMFFWVGICPKKNECRNVFTVVIKLLI